MLSYASARARVCRCRLAQPQSVRRENCRRVDTAHPRHHAVHFSGLAVDLDPIYKLATEKNLLVIEDAAHALARNTNNANRRLGQSRLLQLSSQQKHDDDRRRRRRQRRSQFIKRLDRIRFHGIERDDVGNMDVPEWGGKMNLADVGAALGWRNAKARWFQCAPSRAGGTLLKAMPKNDLLVLPATDSGNSWHMFCVCIDHRAMNTTRAKIQAELQAKESAPAFIIPRCICFLCTVVTATVRAIFQ